jgi:hypothetical protein
MKFSSFYGTRRFSTKFFMHEENISLLTFALIGLDILVLSTELISGLLEARCRQ